MEQKDYQTRYRDEVREFEQLSSRGFYEAFGRYSLREGDLRARGGRPLPQLRPLVTPGCFFHLREGERPTSGAGEQLIRRQEEVFQFFRHPQYILFRLNIDSHVS